MNFAILFKNDDPVLIGVVIILLVMSVATWSVFLMRLFDFLIAKNKNNKLMQLFNQKDFYMAVEDARSNTAPLYNIVASLKNEVTRFEQENSALNQHLSLDNLITRVMQSSLVGMMYRFEKGLTVLASIAATAPFIGLFGTVYGIYKALINISTEGQMSIAAVAGPIGEALIATAIGLFVAIPAVLAYNFGVRSNKKIRQQGAQFCDQLQLRVLASHQEREQ